ncbi:BLUF domain-containing protein [Sphingorhabdus sp.]|uniref:BLUF domain-containing protein n=1 Tax=Sphingorhabdus sp. TaxID=1902408 RepID=UPI00391ADE8E
MRLERLIYVSKSRIEAAGSDFAITQLVREARSRNASLAVSGALLFTGTHFAQILEGRASCLALVMSELKADYRYADMFIAAHYPISSRIFSDWQMAYAGQSQFIAQHINRLLRNNSRSDQRRGVDRLTDIFTAFLAMPNTV